MSNEQKYWNNFYKKFGVMNSSDFSKYIVNYFKNNQNLRLLDSGCGNGRDSYFLSSKFIVTGVDNAFKPENKKNCDFVLDDFINYNKDKFDIIYSRFTFHSITNEEHSKFLKSITRCGTYLCIETRSDKDKSNQRVHGDTHYRNFTNIDYLINLLKEHNFEILFIAESNGFSLYKGEDPVCIRVICRKIFIEK